MARRAEELCFSQLEEFLGKVDSYGWKFSARRNKERYSYEYQNKELRRLDRQYVCRRLVK